MKNVILLMLALSFLCACQPSETISDNGRSYVSFVCQESAVDTEVDCKFLLKLKNKIHMSKSVTEKDCTNLAKYHAKTCHMVEAK